MAVTLTDSAANHVSGMLAKRGHGLGPAHRHQEERLHRLRLCRRLRRRVDDGDQVFESHGVKVVVDARRAWSRSTAWRSTSSSQSLLNEGFEFRNPNIKDQCGCGESFSV
jgi:iron-sulfur cluster assembly protein